MEIDRRRVLERPDLFAQLGIGRPLRRALSQCRNGNMKSVRVLRFDFHPTRDCWTISEVNSDVPGGFAEAGALPRAAAGYVPGAKAGEDPAEAIVAAATPQLEPSARLVFVHATSYADDRQVMQFLAQRFAAYGFRCALVAPDHLRWIVRRCHGDHPCKPLACCCEGKGSVGAKTLPCNNDFARTSTLQALDRCLDIA